MPEFSTWPGCPFSPEDLTGTWKHSLDSFLLYAAGLLLGKRGFLLHNLPLLLAVPAMIVAMRRRPEVRAEMCYLGGWCVATWLMYAALSNNSSGVCCSIRWFVPLLAPAYYVLAVFLKHYPARRGDFLVLSAGGAVLMTVAWAYGPWIRHMVPGFWPLQGAALLGWLVYRLWQRRREATRSSPETALGRSARAA